MVNASKILTVSYGTFSCTLEGFDDPFSTMRSIAEYFRDLAADDRYFGAEPPTPDADMLHRIAEREIQRRVEAKVSDNSVVLRQMAGTDGADSVATTTGIAEPEPSKGHSVDAQIPDQVEDVSGIDPNDDSVAAKLARIRAAVARSRGESEPLLNTVFAEDEHAAAPVALADPTAVADPVAEPEISADDADDNAETDDDLSDLMTAIEGDDADQGDDSVQPEEDDLTAMLDEAVANEIPADEDDDNAALEVAPLELSDLHLSDDAEDDTDDDMLFDEESAADDAFALAAQADSDRNESRGLVLDTTPEETAADPDLPETDTAEDLDLTSVLELQDPAPADEVLADENTSTELSDEDFDLSTLIDAEDDAPESATSDDIAEQPRVRVMKMRRDDFEDLVAETENNAQIESDEADEADSEDPVGADTLAADGIRETLGDTGLSSEDEEELINELVAVELDDEDAFDDARVEDADVPATSETEPAAKASVKTSDASVDRLMDRTDVALEENEGTRRRSAIAHLKAAVAAVRADGDKVKETAEAENAKTMDRFRDDLARAVRPSRVEEPAPTAEQPEAQAETTNVAPSKISSAGPVTPRKRRPVAPLMLVSEQRIDTEETAETSDVPAQPIRPRRIQTTDLDDEAENELFSDDTETGAERAAGNIFSEGTDFQGYVAETGAEGIQELLEASLAYGTLVEGAPNNSRPHIMRRMLSLFSDGSVTREDGLRAFGVLLREGRIQRIQRGQFVLPPSSRFHAETRQANSA